MSTTQPELPLIHHEFRFRCADDVRLPADQGGLWHGVFGLHLRRICCVVADTECRHCMLLHQCRYSYLFSGPRPPESEIMRRYDTIPVPHIFRLEQAHPRTIHAGQDLAIGLVLVGAANKDLALVIQAMAAAGEGGLGPRRTQVWLHDVVQHIPGRDTPHLAAAKGRILDALSPAPPPLPPTPALVRITFTTPYKPSGRAAGADSLDVGLFLMALVRRISLLQYFYTSRKLKAPFSALKAASQTARVIRHDLRRRTASRFAARHGKRIDTSGLIGEIDLAMDGIEPLWPYLHLGQWLNIGKNASMGYGGYRLHGLSS